MRLKYLLILLLGIALTVGCGDDGEGEPEGPNILNYDGDNFTAPTLPDGLYEFAIRFPAVLVRNVEGRSIEQVSFYLYEIPSQLYINISPDFTPTLPGEIVNTQRVTDLRRNSWNTVTLDTPYLLDGNPVWVGIEVTQNSTLQTVGCDAGPANANGDWLYDEEFQNWETFRSRTNDNESVNWNIRAILSE